LKHKLVAIGDIHGCYKTMMTLIDKVKDLYPKDDLKFIFLGDYIDRGPDSAKIVEYLIDHPEHIVLLGNHEDMVLDVVNHPEYESRWLDKNGGFETINSYGEYGYEIPESHMEFFRKLKPMAVFGKWVFVHAGIDPTIADLNLQTIATCIWSRKFNVATSYAGEWKVVHGHTPTVGGKVEQFGDQFNIDTSCVFGYNLTAMVIDRETDDYEFVQQVNIENET